MYAVFCGVHIVVLIGVFVLFLLCVRNTTSPAKLSFMLICFSLFILIFGMYLEMVDSDTTEAAISALRIQYIGMIRSRFRCCISPPAWAGSRYRSRCG